MKAMVGLNRGDSTEVKTMSEQPKAVIPENLPDELVESAQARRKETTGELDVGDNSSAELSEDDGLTLVDDSTPDFDRHYLSMLEGHAWHESTDRSLVGFSESQVPEMVTDRIRETILSGAAIFSDIESIPSSELMQLREYMTETLTDQDGWTTDGLADQLMQLDGIESRDRATLIARTETASVVNTAREEAYEERGLDDAQFRWVSADDQRRTDACEWLSEQTEDGVTMERLKELIEEAPTHDEDMQDDLARPENYVVHPNERSTWVRVVD